MSFLKKIYTVYFFKRNLDLFYDYFKKIMGLCLLKAKLIMKNANFKLKRSYYLLEKILLF